MSPNGRIYDTEQQARDAVAALRARGFGDNTLHLAVPAMDGSTVSASTFTQRDIFDGQVPAYQANAYAHALQMGKSVVIVAPAFGYGGVADEILDGYNPTNPGGFPFVKARNPAPFSNWIGFPVLSRDDRRHTMWTRIMRPLTAPNFAMSSMLGMGLQSKNPAPLSSAIGLKTLSGNDRPWRTSLGMPLLTKSRTPLSSMLGLPLLTRGSRAG